MTTKTKRKYAKVVAAAVAATMTASICMTSLAAFAKADLSTTKKYTNPYATLADALKASGEVNEQIEAEGIVMLKNKTGKAPLAKGAKVTVLGSASLNPSYGGAGSGSIKRPGRDARDWEYVSETAADVYTGLEKDGVLVTNPAVKAAYGKVSAAVETGTYMQLVTEGNGEVEFAGKKYNSLTEGGTLQSVNNYSEYNTAIVVITRSGSEFYDNKAYKVEGHADETDHYLELDDKENQLMAYAKKNFSKVIVLLNGPSALEVGALKNDDKIDAVYWVGQPGWNGFNVLGKVLTGEVNPSGKLVDEWFTKFEYDPTWYNWGSYGQAEILLYGSTERENGTNSSTTITMGLPSTSELSTTNQDHVMDYAEGIYLGYRYAETAYEAILAKSGKAAADAWYTNTIAYPFGYGLSYTSFKKTLKDIKGDLTNKDGKITVVVEVENTGTVAGKEVVQIYSSAPYTDGGIEKAACDLVGFAKTKELKAGEKVEVEVEVAVKDLAAFDYNDANENGYSGYELEAGEYTISVRSDSHTVDDSRKLTAATTLKDWDEDGNPATVNNIFSQTTGNWEMYNTLAYHWTVSGDNHYMTRGTTDEDSTNLSLGEFATAATDIIGTDADKKEAAVDQLKKLSWLLTEDNSFTDETINSRHQQYGATNDPYHDWDNPITIEVETNYTNPWTKTNADIPTAWTQATEVGTNRTQAYTLLGEPMYNADGTENPKWTAFMNQFTWRELALHTESGSFSTPAQETVGLPKTADQDGPAQMGSGWTWTCEVVIASTWNQELAYQQGQQNGYESMLQGTNGWYGPAANNHRNPLSGRNFEYYSQDGVQGGLIVANVIKGATELGVHAYLKHAFMNDQETQRYGMATFGTEQAIRLIYAKPWELAMKLGNLNGTMSAFNNVGNSSSGSYAIMIQLYENEWGFDGYSVTDMYGGEGGSYLNMWSMAQLARGHNIPLGNVLNNRVDPNKDAGVWDASLRDNKGGVMVKGSAAATAEDKESPTQWYWVRTTAMHMMYTQVNGNAMRNGIAAQNNSIKGDAITGATGTAITPVCVIDKEAFDASYGAGKYTVSIFGLPAGLTCDAKTGVLSGAPTEGKVGTVTITVSGVDGYEWVQSTRTVNVDVAISVPVISASAANIVTPAAVELTADNYVAGGAVNNANIGKYVAHTWELSGNLPAGLTLDAETGVISGTASGEGTYKVTVTDKYTKVNSGWWGAQAANEEYKTSYSIKIVSLEEYMGDLLDKVTELEGKVASLEAQINVLKEAIASGKIITGVTTTDTGYTITFSDGSTITLNHGATGATGPQGPEGSQGATGPAGPAGEKGEKGSGCNGSIGTTVGAVSVALALVAAGVVVARKLSRKEN